MCFVLFLVVVMIVVVLAISILKVLWFTHKGFVEAVRCWYVTPPGYACGIFRGWNTTQLCEDYFINHYNLDKLDKDPD